MKRILFSIFTFVCLVGFSASAQAQTAGCLPQVDNAAKAVAAANRTLDVATNEEVIKKNDSVLAMTCFNQSARQVAQTAGTIFSGDFTGSVNTVIDGSMKEMLSNFQFDTLGTSFGSNVLTGVLGDVFADIFPGSYTCSAMQDLWTDVMNTGINGNVQFLTFDQMVAASTGAGGTTFLDNLVAEGGGGAIGNASTQLGALPVNTIPSFVGTQSLLDVMTAAGF